MLKEEFRRAFFSWAFVLALVITSVCFAIGLKDYGGPVAPLRPEDRDLFPFDRNAFDAFIYAAGMGGFFAIFAPLIAVLPFAASFITDRTSGYITFILSRTSFRRYRTSKYVANLLAGGVSTSLPLLVGYGIINIFYKRGFPPVPVTPSEGWVNVRLPWVNANGTFGYLYRTKPDLYIFFLIGLAFLWGAAWATAGLATSSVVRNRYYALAAPFVFYIIVHFVTTVLWIAGWSPLFNFAPFLYKGTSSITTFVELGALFIVSTICIVVFAKKKHVYE